MSTLIEFAQRDVIFQYKGAAHTQIRQGSKFDVTLPCIKISLDDVNTKDYDTLCIHIHMPYEHTHMCMYIYIYI